MHRYLHDNHAWYKNWHHHPLRIHTHLGAVVLAAAFALVVLFSPGSTGLQAEVGGYPISGRLLESSGRPVNNGTHEIEFKLYNVETGGLAIWTEVHRGEDRILTANGYFTTELGRFTRLDSFDLGENTYYLGVAVDGEPELSPRWIIDQVPLTPFE